MLVVMAQLEFDEADELGISLTRMRSAPTIRDSPTRWHFGSTGGISSAVGQPSVTRVPDGCPLAV